VYIGISPSKFDQLLKDGQMPQPRRIGTRKIWDIRELDIAFEALPSNSPRPDTSWDDFDRE
jgi:predicted DNA-binding transcriptional regulator AlpA